MKTPSLFAHYWSENETLTTFQEVMHWDINPIMIEIIQTELTLQLNSDFAQHNFPNFNWESDRFVEKWGAAMQSILYNVSLPEKIWLDWIHDLTNKTINTSEENKPASLEEIYPSFDELLNAEVYYSSPADSLDEMKEDDAVMEENIEVHEEITISLEEEEVEDIDEEVDIEEEEEEEEEDEEENDANLEDHEIAEGQPSMEVSEFNFILEKTLDQDPDFASNEDFHQENHSELIQEEEVHNTQTPLENNDIEFSVLNLEIGSKAPSEKKILDLLGDSPEEKVFETLQTNQDNSLKDRIHTEMTSSLAETLPLFQKINFIQNLFDGESSYLDQVIQYIDHEAHKSTDWKAVLQSKYATFQRADNQELWNELYELIERKFS